MTTNELDSGRAANAEPALVSDQAPSGLDPSGFDPARMTDEELVESVATNVYEAGWHRRHSVYDDNCSALYREADRRGKVELYERGYRQACRRAGVKP